MTVTLPPDYTGFAPKDAGSDTNDSDVDPLTGESDPFVLAEGEFNPWFAAGLLFDLVSEERP